MEIIIAMYERFITASVDSSWHEILQTSLVKMNQEYLQGLLDNPDWLPGIANIFNAFSLPLSKTRYILFGESPYPRQASANGYAFWDAAVTEIWSETGLSKVVNRATSLRNIIKMLLIAEQVLSPKNTSQQAIANLDKAIYIKKLSELFKNLQEQGFLLLNATPVLHPLKKVQEDSKYWLIFMDSLLDQLRGYPIDLILFGKIAQIIGALSAANNFSQLKAEHPYNLSFINNPEVIAFFKPLHLLCPS